MYEHLVGQIGAAGPNDQSKIGHVQKIEAAAHANHPLSMLDIERPRSSLNFC